MMHVKVLELSSDALQIALAGHGQKQALVTGSQVSATVPLGTAETLPLRYRSFEDLKHLPVNSTVVHANK